MRVAELFSRYCEPPKRAGGTIRFGKDGKSDG
jgi:hypothetical protein